MEVFNNLAKSDNQLIALLASIVAVLAGVIVYQWRYTMNKTVPKWIWDTFIGKVDEILKIQERTNTIIDERLKR